MTLEHRYVMKMKDTYIAPSKNDAFFFAHFLNERKSVNAYENKEEAEGERKPNCYLDKFGRICADKYIRNGTELTWCYGPKYNRSW